MAVTSASFRTMFPEFTDTAKFPDAQINAWLDQAPNQLSASRLGKSYDLAVMLFIAHNIVLSARAVASAAGSGVPGQATGPVSSKSVDKVSVSYDTGATAIGRAGAWNATSYGQRLYTLLRACGAGPLYFLPDAPAI